MDSRSSSRDPSPLWTRSEERFDRRQRKMRRPGPSEDQSKRRLLNLAPLEVQYSTQGGGTLVTSKGPSGRLLNPRCGDDEEPPAVQIPKDGREVLVTLNVIIRASRKETMNCTRCHSEHGKAVEFQRELPDCAS